MEDGTMAEVYKASDYSWGGTIVDAQFKEIVNGLFGNNEYFEKLHELAPLDALEFERNFEAKKRQICSNTRENIRLQIPPCLMCYANTVFGNEHMQLLTFASMYVQNEHFKSFFTIAKDRIIGILKVILKEMKTVDFIIMVGGFSSSKFLTDEIKNTPAFSSIRFISPNEPATAVLRGAVLFGYHPRSVSARMCSIPTDFDSKVHPQSKHIIVDGKERCKDVLSVLLYKDELGKYAKLRTHRLLSRHKNNNRKFISNQRRKVTKSQLAFDIEKRFRCIAKIVCMTI